MRTGTKILLSLLISVSALSAYAGSPAAYLNFANFTTPQRQNYVETYLSVVGSSLNYVKNANGQYSAKAHVTLTFKLKDSVVASANFNVLSPTVSDSLNKPNFVDVHRFILPKGTYNLVYTLDDPNDASHKTISLRQPVHVGYRADSACISDAEYLSSFTPSKKSGPYNKCGYEMIPYVFTDYTAQVKKMSIYCEIYNTLKDVAPGEKITVEYSIESRGDYMLDLANNFHGSVQLDADSVVPFLAQVPIDNLPTGTYQLVLVVKNKNSHVIAWRTFDFNKDNPGIKSTRIPGGFAVYMMTRDTLIQSIRCLAPICNGSEQDYVISDSLKWVPTPELRRFFYYFWRTRDSLDPLTAWQKYLDDVMAVDNSFNVPGLKGYRTDRGRVYLEYGAPNQRIVEKSNPVTYPHEIWQYYRMKDGQTNVKFVFYTTSVETNNYVLLHSTATGEISNPQWQVVLYSRLGTPSDLDQQTIQDQMGEDLNDEFNNPH